MIKYNTQGLQAIIEQSTSEYKSTLGHFFNDENITTKLDTNQFFLLYLLWGKETRHTPTDLSVFLLSAEIDPLPHMNEILNEMFKGCLIREITLDHFEYIGAQAFWNNELTDIYVGDKTQQIYSQAFGYNKLKSVSLPKYIYLGANVFEECNQLKEITYRGTIEDWKNISSEFSSHWNEYSKIEKIICTDGEIPLENK